MKWITRRLPSRPPQKKWVRLLWWINPWPWWYRPEIYWPREYWPAGPDVSVIAKKELPRLRQRGIDYIDLKTHNQNPLEIPHLEKLAWTYTSIENPDRAYDRVSCVQYMMGMAVLTLKRHSAYAQTAILIKELFFDPEDMYVPAKPAALLKAAKASSRNEHGDPLSDDDFARLRRREYETFAGLMASFVRKQCLEVAQKEKRLIMRRGLIHLMIFAGLLIAELLVAMRHGL